MSVYNSSGQKTTSVYSNTAKRVTSTVYTSDGESRQVIDSNQYANPTIETLFSISLFPMQSFSVFNGVMFQLKAGGSNNIKDVMDVIDINRKTRIASDVPITSGHGNSSCFSDEFYSIEDTYPLLYVADHDDPFLTIIHVNRVTTNSAELIKSYKFPLDRTGHYGQAVVDSDNDIIYIVGTSGQEIKSAGRTSRTIITKWNYSNAVYDETDGKYSPSFISSIETDFFAIHQGITLFNGLVWIISWDYNNSENYVAVINPETGDIVQIIDLGIHEECEGIAFISSNEAIVGVQGGTYKKLTFS